MIQEDYQLIKSFNPINIWEIGVGPPADSRSISFARDGIPVHMFEPFKPNFDLLVQSLRDWKSVNLYNLALGDEHKVAELNMLGTNSYIEGTISPWVFTSQPMDGVVKSKIFCCDIASFDYGQIDIALIDTEGCEWQIIKNMVSRPRLIAVETHCSGNYQTPDVDKLKQWMVDNKYKFLKSDGTDTWYKKD